MSNISNIFDRLENITQQEGQTEFISAIKTSLVQKQKKAVSETSDENTSTYQLLRTFLNKIISAIDELAAEIEKNDSTLISVKNQKILRTCIQLITSLGISNCLLPGLGISLAKRCSSSYILPKLSFKCDETYELLVDCTNFFNRCYKVTILKTIIFTLHLSDYLAALIQLSFAPLRPPGTYSNYNMTSELYDKLNADRQQYVLVYEYLVANTFQPILMKELLALQCVIEPPPPTFARRIITKELSRRLLAPGGLLSLTRCFIESCSFDIGFEWKKIYMICKLVSLAKHGLTENDYLINIVSQLEQMMSVNNTHYLSTAVACLISLKEKYPDSSPVKDITKFVFEAFDCESSNFKTSLPGTVILSPQEVNNRVNLLHAYVCSVNLDWSITLLSPNLDVLFLIGCKCTKHEDLHAKLKDIFLKSFEKLSKLEIYTFMSEVLLEKTNSSSIIIEQYESGITIKSGSGKEKPSENEELLYFLKLFNSSTNRFVKAVFEASLDILIKLSIKRKGKMNKDLLALEDEPVLLDVDNQYATILQLLSVISMSPKVVVALNNDPNVLMKFIKHFLSKPNSEPDECISLALALLNMILANNDDVPEEVLDLVPVLKELSKDETNFNHMLCKEALSLMSSEVPHSETACGKAIIDAFDDLLPVRAHGLMELTKLITDNDPETLSKKHYIFCLFQEQLKDPDSYIYLSAIIGLSMLCTHCTEDVLNVLCKEFLEVSSKQIETNAENNAAETRLKIGEVIVKVTKHLGQMAIVHKTILLNTMLSACRDDDPLIRTSALSNLAEIALVLHYKIGNIIYELLLCVWGIIETDKAVECRRAAVMVISSLLMGLGKETLIQLKDNLLPIYRTLKKLLRDESEDPVVKLHAQIAMEELNDIVKQFLSPEMCMEKRIFILDQPDDF